ncbi:MAG: hypothetical protein ACR2GG_10745 [Gemmatimonadaceae bacterium]
MDQARRRRLLERADRRVDVELVADGAYDAGTELAVARHRGEAVASAPAGGWRPIVQHRPEEGKAPVAQQHRRREQQRCSCAPGVGSSVDGDAQWKARHVLEGRVTTGREDR